VLKEIDIPHGKGTFLRGCSAHWKALAVLCGVRSKRDRSVLSNVAAERIIPLSAPSCSNGDYSTHRVAWWLSGRASDLQFTGRGFNSRPVAFT